MFSEKEFMYLTHLYKRSIYRPQHWAKTINGLPLFSLPKHHWNLKISKNRYKRESTDK
jgi:hypothetical protein